MIGSGTSDDRRPPITPALALRVAILGGVTLVLFATVFFRLWYLQVLSGDQYVSQANDNRVREIRVPAPRGDIVDRSGRSLLVTSRQATVVQIEPSELPSPGAPRRELYERLGAVLQERPARIQQDVIDQRRRLPYAPAIIKTDVSPEVLAYLEERATDFPGVHPDRLYLRQYPQHNVAAHLLGTVGQINPRQLSQQHFRDVPQGTVVGQGGVEYEYDRYLRGRDGARRLTVNSLGEERGTLSQRQPIAGRRVQLSLDLGLQKAAQEALARASGGLPGAFVAMDPRDGAILAMGSYPSFDPSIFARPVPASVFRRLNSEANGSPLYNRAIAGLYPTGSTFKPITALAGLQRGVITPDTPINDPGCLKVGVQEFCNAGKVVNGTVSLRRAIEVSSDVFFYTVGRDLNPKNGEPLQRWARDLGLGRATGIDLPGEFKGLIPNRRWRSRIADRELTCRKRRRIGACGISDARPWSVGDNINLSVGQGDLQATPLQMAVAYAALANGGRVVRPHLGTQVQDSQGRLVQAIDPPASRRVKIDEGWRSAILDGLRGAASAPGGTSTDVFKGWPHAQLPVFGKTGTAERPPHPDQSWYVAFVKDTPRPLVVAVTVEGGGFGAEAAAPAARLILAHWFRQGAKLVRGKSRTR